MERRGNATPTWGAARLSRPRAGVLGGQGREGALPALFQLLEGITGHEFTGLRRWE